MADTIQLRPADKKRMPGQWSPEDDRLWNDHLRRLTQLKALMALLSMTDGGDLEAFGADVLTIAADLAEQVEADFKGRLLELAVKGSVAEQAERS